MTCAGLLANLTCLSVHWCLYASAWRRWLPLVAVSVTSSCTVDRKLWTIFGSERFHMRVFGSFRRRLSVVCGALAPTVKVPAFSSWQISDSKAHSAQRGLLSSDLAKNYCCYSIQQLRNFQRLDSIASIVN